MEKACDEAHITLNKNAVVGDSSAMNPGGVRIGTPAMTSRGLMEQDFDAVASFLHEVCEVCVSACRGEVGWVAGGEGYMRLLWVGGRRILVWWPASCTKCASYARV